MQMQGTEYPVKAVSQPHSTQNYLANTLVGKSFILGGVVIVKDQDCVMLMCRCVTTFLKRVFTTGKRPLCHIKKNSRQSQVHFA
uniref:Uncharacterized protein n=1 Tax=Saccharomyces cerevisiae TaxID=4932 RepID=A2P2I5_YEASX|nr:unknown [Saccharomyces cerevisiae]